MNFEPLVLLQHGAEKLLQLKGQRDGQGNLTPHLDKTGWFTLSSNMFLQMANDSWNGWQCVKTTYPEESDVDWKLHDVGISSILFTALFPNHLVGVQ